MIGPALLQPIDPVQSRARRETAQEDVIVTNRCLAAREVTVGVLRVAIAMDRSKCVHETMSARLVIDPALSSFPPLASIRDTLKRPPLEQSGLHSGRSRMAELVNSF